LPGINIGEWATIGAGSVILEDVVNGATVVGNPAKRIDK
jgi:acetyltransferase EpsM